MVLTREDLRAQLMRGSIAPVYVLFGAETYLRDRAAKHITDISFEAGELRDFNDPVITLESADDLPRVIAAARQMPMMAARRVVRVDNVRISASGYRDTVTEAHENLLTEYFNDPSPSSVVIFVAEELNGVRKMGKFLRERTAAVEFAPLNDSQFSEWARRAVRDAGGEIDEAALRYLLSRMDPDVRRLENEIGKLVAASLPTGRITREMIGELVPNSRELRNFDLTDHLTAGRGREAVKAMKKILDDGAEPLALLGLISYNYRRMMIAKEMMERSAPRNKIASAINLHGRGQDEFLAAARRADKQRLTAAIRHIADADLAIKTSLGGGAGPRMQVEMLVCSLAV